MRRFKKLIIIFISALAMINIANASDTSVPKVTALRNFNVNNYLGTWYEVARLPIDFEDDCVDGITATYKLKKNTMLVNTRCTTAERKAITNEGVARFTFSPTIAQMKINFSSKWLRWTRYGNADYWVLRTDYTTFAVVASPNKDSAWIFSRTPQMDVKQLQLQVAYLQNLGYDISTLIYNKSSIQ